MYAGLPNRHGRTGVCRACGRHRQLRLDGLLRKHLVRKAACLGSGQTPDQGPIELVRRPFARPVRVPASLLEPGKDRDLRLLGLHARRWLTEGA